MTHLSLLSPKQSTQKQSGFSLIEMAIVLVILGFILGGILGPLSTQREVQKRNEAEQQLKEIREALLGFVQIKGRLPCPASLISDGREVVTTGNCSTPTATDNIFVPYVDLGIRGSIISGELVDPWQQPVVYRLTSVSTWAYAKQINLTNNTAANFQICTITTCTPATSILAAGVVVVLFTKGPDLVSTNTASATDFVSDPPPQPTITTAYDDRVLWISQPELIFALSKTR